MGKHFLEVGVVGGCCSGACTALRDCWARASPGHLQARGKRQVPSSPETWSCDSCSQSQVLELSQASPGPHDFCISTGLSQTCFSDDWLSASHERRHVTGTPRSLGTLRALSDRVRTCAHQGDFLLEGREGEGKDCHEGTTTHNATEHSANTGEGAQRPQRRERIW